MPQPPRFTDIHCHLLPGIDDGAGDWDEALAMARMAVHDGIGTIIATPHQLGSYAGNRGMVIRQLTARFQEALERLSLPLEVVPGADVRIEPELVRRLRSGDVLTLADRRRHVLLELPHDLFIPIEGLLAHLQTAGVVGILSHPERNLGILRQPDVLPRLVEAGCLLQVTAGALVGRFGPEIEKFARWMVGQRLVHFVATDAHGPRTRRPQLSRAFECVAELAGWETAVALCCDNPAAVAEGRRVTAELPVSQRSGWSGWFGRRRAG
jgi:protein-tyrosine phosphatase